MSAKWLAKLFGGLLVLASLYFIGDQLWASRASLAQWRPTAATGMALVFATVAYALANYCLSGAWILLLRMLGESTIGAGQLTRIFGKSQIGKYAPGNVLHLAARHVMAKSTGCGHQGLVIAALLENTGLVAAASLISALTLGMAARSIQALHWLPWFTPAILAAYVLFPRLLHHFKRSCPVVEVRRMLAPFLLYLLFFLVAGAGLLVIAASEVGRMPDSPIWIGAFAIAWVAGFLTPGSPSGIGIREAILVLLLAPVAGQESALLLALAYRVVTVLGDVLFLFLSHLPRPVR